MLRTFLDDRVKYYEKFCSVDKGRWARIPRKTDSETAKKKKCLREDACSVCESGKEVAREGKSPRGTMMFWAIFFLHGAQVTGLQPNSSVGSPENITVQVIDAKTVQVFWSSARSNVERFDVTYNPTEDKIVSQAAGNSQSIVLKELRPDTQYQVTITAVIGGKNYKSRRIVFRTAADKSINSEIYPTQASYDGKGTMSSTKYVTVDPTAKYMPQTSSTVRGVELGLVLLALVVWIVAIALFFHRWGKIRMLLPYQPDYKTQQALKVPGTGTTMSTNCSGNSATERQQEGPGCLQSLYERVTACRCCYERIPGDQPSENEASDTE